MRCKRVLIADDNRDGADALSALLSHWGHEVAVTGNGRDAVMTAKAFHPEVAILDLDMPLMDGFEAARALRNREANAMIIALTGLPPGLLPERMLGSCFDHQFFKPVQTEQLRQLLDGFPKSSICGNDVHDAATHAPRGKSGAGSAGTA